ncbi:unnamed protein product [Oikopleura dioica]|uniref:Uncharacterized protein n=1 Tax=Oikopleura dioica TaxID=34765 RepID=E4Y6X8_OIKDI|nr:unnamed protein product [Oikopleura dioica]
MEAKQDLDGWTDLKGEICHVHSASTHYGKSPNSPFRCRGMAFMFPGDDHATMISIIGLTASHDPNGHKTQLMTTIALKEPLRRAAIMKKRNFKIKMQLNEDVIDEACPGYKEMMAEINELKCKLGIEFIFKKQRQKKTMSTNEREVHDRAEHASRILYGTNEFPTEWLDSDIMKEVAEQTFLPGYFWINKKIQKENPLIIEKTLGWKIQARTYDIYGTGLLLILFFSFLNTYSLLGFPIPQIIRNIQIKEEDDDDQDEGHSSQRKRRSCGPTDDGPCMNRKNNRKTEIYYLIL